ncbi:MAG: TolC family protein [Planctomycetota bacterium JB042]
MTPTRRSLPSTVFVLVSLAGCGTVDVTPEERSARDAIEAATGLDLDVAPADGSLTVEEATRRALVAHPGIAAAFHEIGVAKAAWVRSGLPSNPVLNLAFFLPSGGGSAGVEAGLAASLLDLWRIPLREEVAAADLRATVLRVADLAAATARDTRVAYFDTLAAAEELRLRREEEALRARTRDQVAARRSAGRATEWEESVAESARLAAALRVLEARRDAERARRALAERMAAPFEDRTPLSSDLPAAAAVATDDDSLASWVARALETRLELRALREEIGAARAREKLDASAWLSRATVGVATERADRPKGTPARNPSRSGPTVSVPLPVFDRGDAAAAEARYRRERLELLLGAAELRVEREVRDAAGALATAREAAAFCRDALVPQAERRLALARSAYEAGVGSITEVTRAERDLLDARRTELRTRREAATASADLARAVGGPAP